MAETTDNPHDRYFKEAFSQIDILCDFLNVYLPDDLRTQLDFSSISRDPDSYTDESLSEHFADLVFTAQLGRKPVRIALLLEHKSFVVPHIHFQLNRYMLNAWEQQLSQKKQLLPMIPIVIYHGRRRWRKQPLTSYFTDVPDEAFPYVPNFDYVLVDLSTITDRLPAFATAYARLTGVLLQNSRQRRTLHQALLAVAQDINWLLSQERGERFFQTSLIYLTWVTKLTKHEVVVIFRGVSQQAENYNMSLYEQLIQEGVQKGVEKGVELGIEQGIEQGIDQTAIKAVRAMRQLNMDGASIAAALELPLERILRYIEQIDRP